MFLFIVSACGTDNYVGRSSPEKSQEDARNCRHLAYKKIYEAKDSDPTLPIVGGVFGGALGGAAAGALTSSFNHSDKNEKLDPNYLIQQCMKKLGYSGSSQGYD